MSIYEFLVLVQNINIIAGSGSRQNRVKMTSIDGTPDVHYIMYRVYLYFTQQPIQLLQFVYLTVPTHANGLVL